MLPRGEVALIVAGIGLSRGIVGEVVFGVSIMMTLITTIVAPLLLVPAFSRGGSGLRRPTEKKPRLPSTSTMPGLEVAMPDAMRDLFVDRLLIAAEAAGWQPSYESADENIYLLRSRGDAAQIAVKDHALHIDASDTRQPEFAALVKRVRDDIAEQMREIEVRNGKA
jgi:hypothetical protein